MYYSDSFLKHIFVDIANLVRQRMVFGNGWSLVTDGVWQRMEFGNGWSLVTDGVW
jgi:hypothetical protein